MMKIINYLFVILFMFGAGASLYKQTVAEPQLPTIKNDAEIQYITPTPTPTPTNAPKVTGTDSASYHITEEERYMLAKLAMAEAEGQGTVGKALVVRVVFNRLESGWANSLKSVVFQKGQFSPISNGRYDKVEPDEECYEAVRMVLGGWDESNGAIYFRTVSTDKSLWHYRALTHLFTYGAHDFFK